MLAFVACGVLVAAHLMLHHLLLRRLRRVHAQAWEDLGRPTVVTNSSIAIGLAVRRFIKRGRHRALDDPALERVVRLWKASSRIGIVVAVLSIGLFALLLAR